MKPTACVSLLFAFLAAASCSSSSTTPSVDYTGACDRLATRCHSGTSGLAKECHELGHGGDDAKCGPRERECLAECPEGGGGHDAATGEDSDLDGGPADAADAAAAGCTELCTCLEATCADGMNYPFTEPGSCLSACASFSVDERACFRSFCEGAADGGSKAHACDHATGKLGTQECP